MRILVIDDDRFMQLMLKKLIESFSPTYLVECASELEEAEILLKLEKIDLIFLDLSFPTSSVQDVLQFIKKYRDQGVVVLTAHEEEEYIYPCLKQGAFDYVAKTKLQRDHLKRIIGYVSERHEK